MSCTKVGCVLRTATVGSAVEDKGVKMIIWSVTNQKGGVGKTTTTVSLAGFQALLGKRVLLIDLDPHGSLTTYFFQQTATASDSVYALFRQPAICRKNLLPLIRSAGIKNLFIIPSSPSLAALDGKCSGQRGQGLILTRWLDLAREQFDHVYLDCPPVLGVLMVNALAACNHLVIPVQTEYLAVTGLKRMRETIRMIESSKGIRIAHTIVPTMYDQRTNASVNSLGMMKQSFRRELWDGFIPEDTLFREASFYNKPISHFALTSRGARSYHRLAKDLTRISHAH